MKKILELLEKDASLTAEKIAVMLDMKTEEVEAVIDDCKKRGIILGSRTLINWEKTDFEPVSAIIALRATPQRDEGFDKIARKIYQYDEVSEVYLTSGAFDICLKIEGKTMKEVALFVAEKLAPLDEVISTNTLFVLRSYKIGNTIVDEKKYDKREILSL